MHREYRAAEIDESASRERKLWPSFPEKSFLWRVGLSSGIFGGSRLAFLLNEAPALFCGTSLHPGVIVTTKTRETAMRTRPSEPDYSQPTGPARPKLVQPRSGMDSTILVTALSSASVGTTIGALTGALGGWAGALAGGIVGAVLAAKSRKSHV